MAGVKGSQPSNIKSPVPGAQQSDDLEMQIAEQEARLKELRRRSKERMQQRFETEAITEQEVRNQTNPGAPPVEAQNVDNVLLEPSEEEMRLETEEMFRQELNRPSPVEEEEQRSLPQRGPAGEQDLSAFFQQVTSAEEAQPTRRREVVEEPIAEDMGMELGTFFRELEKNTAPEPTFTENVAEGFRYAADRAMGSFGQTNTEIRQILENQYGKGNAWIDSSNRVMYRRTKDGNAIEFDPQDWQMNDLFFDAVADQSRVITEAVIDNSIQAATSYLTKAAGRANPGLGLAVGTVAGAASSGTAFYAAEAIRNHLSGGQMDESRNVSTEAGIAAAFGGVFGAWAGGSARGMQTDAFTEVTEDALETANKRLGMWEESTNIMRDILGMERVGDEMLTPAYALRQSEVPKELQKSYNTALKSPGFRDRNFLKVGQNLTDSFQLMFQGMAEKSPNFSARGALETMRNSRRVLGKSIENLRNVASDHLEGRELGLDNFRNAVNVLDAKAKEVSNLDIEHGFEEAAKVDAYKALGLEDSDAKVLHSFMKDYFDLVNIEGSTQRIGFIEETYKTLSELTDQAYRRKDLKARNFAKALDTIQDGIRDDYAAHVTKALNEKFVNSGTPKGTFYLNQLAKFSAGVKAEKSMRNLLSRDDMTLRAMAANFFSNSSANLDNIRNFKALTEATEPDLWDGFVGNYLLEYIEQASAVNRPGGGRVVNLQPLVNDLLGQSARGKGSSRIPKEVLRMMFPMDKGQFYSKKNVENLLLAADAWNSAGRDVANLNKADVDILANSFENLTELWTAGAGQKTRAFYDIVDRVFGNEFYDSFITGQGKLLEPNARTKMRRVLGDPNSFGTAAYAFKQAKETASTVMFGKDVLEGAGTIPGVAGITGKGLTTEARQFGSGAVGGAANRAEREMQDAREASDEIKRLRRERRRRSR